MASYSFKKLLLATAAMAGMLVNSQAHAQVNNEKGNVDISSYIFTSTCALNLDSAAWKLKHRSKK